MQQIHLGIYSANAALVVGYKEEFHFLGLLGDIASLGDRAIRQGLFFSRRTFSKIAHCLNHLADVFYLFL